MATGNAAIARGEADLVAFGVPFLANPDLPQRYRTGASLNAPDQATFYAGEEKGTQLAPSAYSTCFQNGAWVFK